MRVDEIQVNGRTVCEALVLTSVFERLRGLLGTERPAPPVRLLRCRSIHTFGMAYPIDVAFVGPDDRVCASERDVDVGRVLSCAAASWVLERPSDKSMQWPDIGDVVSAVPLRRDGSVPLRCGTQDERSA